MSKNKRKRGAIHIKPNRAEKVRPFDATEKNAKKLLLRKIQETQKIIMNVEKTSKMFTNVLESINGEFNCRQFQMIKMDYESILAHCESLKTDGPEVAHREIPLEESEIADEDQPGFKPEIVND